VAGGDEHDPFKDLVLDDEFVRGGKYEAPARTRGAIARHGGDTSWRSPGNPGGPNARRPKRRRLLIGAVVLALVAGGWFAVSHSSGSSAQPAALRRASAPTPTPGVTSPAATPTPQPEELTDQAYVHGDCYTWNPRLTQTTARAVPCAVPHLMQALERHSLSEYGRSAPYPTAAQWNAIIDARCAASAAAFLGYGPSEANRYAGNALRPLARDWAEGARSIICDIQDNRLVPLANLTGPHAPVPTVMSGDARTTSRWFVPAAGTCTTNFLLTGVASPVVVPCAQPHDREYVGSTALADATDPSNAAQGAEDADRCQPIADAYAGLRVARTSTRYVTGWQIDAASWTAGDRLVACLVVTQTASGKPLQLPGSVKAPAAGQPSHPSSAVGKAI
jgi:hypothetical protein